MHQGPKVIGLGQVHDLANHLTAGRVRARVRPPRTRTQEERRTLTAGAPVDRRPGRGQIELLELVEHSLQPPPDEKSSELVIGNQLARREQSPRRDEVRAVSSRRGTTAGHPSSDDSRQKSGQASDLHVLGSGGGTRTHNLRINSTDGPYW